MGMNLSNFEKKRDWLFCIDSDGCAMDTMDIKHIRCFGPCMVEEWGLEQWSEELLTRWNRINLYSITRGINRFKGLAKMLREVNSAYKMVEGIEVLEKWVLETPELSTEALEQEILKQDNICLKKALSWSRKVNECINSISFEDKKPFEGVKEALEYAHQYGDIAIVSSANRQAVVEEWERYHLLEHVDIILAQDAGTKAHCIRELVKKGYDKEHVLMVGDAPGDQDAAKTIGVFYYPILVRYESDSWREFKERAVGKLMDGTYGGAYEIKKEAEFLNNLK
ncbi:MAG: HAD hydrolase-like protein [Lachnospiraceae bacterium]|nr:HAD hydrolase-like protein [Lachnospiraceae bacterium]